MDSSHVAAGRSAPWPVRFRVRWRALFGGSLGWRDPRYLADRPGEERALRFIAMLLLIHRASYLVPAVASAATIGTRGTVLTIAMLCVAVGWNVGLAFGIRRRGWFPRWAVLADVALVCGLMLVGTATISPDQVLTTANWPARLAYGTAALIGTALPSVRAVALWFVLVGTRFFAPVLVFGDPLLPADGVAGVVDSYFWYAIALYFMHRFLCGQGRQLDETVRSRLLIEARRTADRARYAERNRQYRELHDTVLTTLTAIARGGLDHREDEVRRRCASDADYVRRLVGEDTVERPSTLGARLADVIAGAQTLGVRVRYLHDELPEELPSPVVAAFADASREALNNVAAHSGGTDAWLTVRSEDGVLTLRVVDRGRGFDPETMVPGFGVRSSITDRMREVGGTATLFGMPENGVCVELVWPGDQSG